MSDTIYMFSLFVTFLSGISIGYAIRYLFPMAGRKFGAPASQKNAHDLYTDPLEELSDLKGK